MSSQRSHTVSPAPTLPLTIALKISPQFSFRFPGLPHCTVHSLPCSQLSLMTLVCMGKREYLLGLAQSYIYVDLPAARNIFIHLVIGPWLLE